MKWEYKTINVTLEGVFSKKLDAEELERAFNQLGHDQWELVSTLGKNIGLGETNEILAVFKRPRP